METTITSPFSPSDAGCWYDSHRGYTDISLEIIGDAISQGMETDFDHDTWEDGNPEELDWAAEKAESYLSNLAPEGFWIGWNDGDFGMWEMDAESLDETPEDYPCLF